jgi:hypothetical protein
MATVYGVNATKLYNTVPSVMIAPGDCNGEVRAIYDIYTLTADLAAADVIVMGTKIPKGARVIEAHIKWADLDAAGGTIDVGWQASVELESGSALVAADADGFFVDLDVATAGQAALSAATHNANPGYLKEFAAAVQPVITIDGDTDATSGSVSLVIFYV